MERLESISIGRFQIVRQLGKGAQGIVFLATDPLLQRRVAVKALQARWARAKALQRDFLREARTVSKLQHPNIVPIFEAGEHQGTPYLVFEYVDGISLLELIEKKEGLTVSGAVALMRQILDGVGYAHEQRIVHRDLKPANILISKSGVPRVMDFGLSQVAGDPGGTSEGDLRGTLQYMSPEHFSETPMVGPGSDVFALGLIFYEMLTLTPAITGENHFNTIYKIIHEPTVAPSLLNPKVDVGLDGIVLKAVRKELNARFPDANSMREALDDYLARKNRGQEAAPGETPTHSTIDFLMRRMRHKPDFPAFSKCVMDVNKMTSSTSAATAKELANVILRDYSLTNKLLKLVNSSFYGQVGGKVTSINKAVVILGFEQVRLAASSLMLFTHLQGKSATGELRDAMIKSFMSGMVARDLANGAQIRTTEVAFICSMFHDLGTNLTIYYFPEEYAEIKSLMSTNGEDMQSAALSVLGVSLGELGVNVARGWKFPETIVYCMRGLPSGPVEKPSSPLDQIRHFSVFANELCGLASSRMPGTQAESLRRLKHRFEGSFSISESEVLTLLGSSAKKVQKYAVIMNIDSERSPFIQGLRKFIEAADVSNACDTREGPAPENSTVREAEDFPIRREGSKTEGADRPVGLQGLSPPEAGIPSAGIWEGVLKLKQKLGLKRQCD